MRIGTSIDSFTQCGHWTTLRPMNSDFMFSIRLWFCLNPSSAVSHATGHRRHRQRRTRAKSPEQDNPEAQLKQPCRRVRCVTLPCVSNSRFRSWATRESSWWTGWSWQPYTSPVALHHPRRPELGLRVGYWSVPEWGSPGPAGACCCPAGRRCPWQIGSEWAGISPSLPARRRQPGASSPVWAAPWCFWERLGLPRQPQGWGTSPGSKEGRDERWVNMKINETECMRGASVIYRG